MTTATKAMLAAAAAGLLAAGAGGCGGDRRPQGRPTKAPAAVPAAAARAARPDTASGSGEMSDNGLQALTGEGSFTSGEGGFTAVFPPGCARVHTRIMPRGAGDAERQVVQCYCDLTTAPNTGVMVTTYFKLRDEKGGAPTLNNVTAILQEMIGRYGMQVVQDGTLRRDDVEGVRLFCRQARGPGEMWLQGMLAGDRVFVMHAWRPGPQGITDEQVTRFFNTFRLE